MHVHVEMPDARLKAAGVSSYNKPKATPHNAHHSHVVVAKVGGTVKTIRFGSPHVRGAGKHPSSKHERARRQAFKKRHAENIARGKLSAAWWANKVKW